MASRDRYRPLSPLSTAFAAEYRGWAAANGIRQDQIADQLGRNRSYVSERMAGKRPLDTDDVDALAALTQVLGKDLLVELARRAQGNTKNVSELRPTSPDLFKIPLDEERLAATDRERASDDLDKHQP